MSEDRKLEGDVNWIKNIFPEAVNFIKQELISEFVNDLYKKDNKIDCDCRCAGEPCKDCTNYTVCDDCSYLIIKKWEEKIK